MAKIETLGSSTGVSFEDRFRGLQQGSQEYQAVLAELLDTVTKLQDLDIDREERLWEYLNGLNSVENSWKEINNYISQQLSYTGEYQGRVQDVRTTLRDISDIVSSTSKQITAQLAPVSRLSSIARELSDIYSIQGKYEEQSLLNIERRAMAAQNSWDFEIKRIAGLSREADLTNPTMETEQAIEKARKLLQIQLTSIDGQLRSADLTRGQRVEMERMKNLRIAELENLDVENRKKVLAVSEEAKARRQESQSIHQATAPANILAKVANRIGLSSGVTAYQDYIQNLGKENEDRRQAKLNLTTATSDLGAARLNLQGIQGDRDDKAVELQKAIRKLGELKFSGASEKDINAQRTVALDQMKEKEGLDLKVQKAEKRVNLQKGKVDLAQNAVSALGKAPGKMKMLAGATKAVLGAVGGSLMKIVSTVAIALFTAFKKVDEEAVKLQQYIGSYQLNAAAANTSLASASEYLKTMAEAAKSTGLDVSGIFDATQVANAAEFQKLTGASATATSNLLIRSKLVGQSTDEYRKALTAGANEGNKVNRSTVALGEVQKGVLEASNATALSYRNNAQELGRAVVAAKNLGMELAAVEGLSDKLLDFESSISNEMEAQLLTGMDLNLSRAREMALRNDLAGVAEEIQRQGMTSEKFASMNRIQQEGIAKALGMSKDELAKSLILRELNNGASKEAIKAAQEMNDYQVEALSLAGKWDTIKTKIADAFSPLFVLLSDVLTPIMTVVGDVFGYIGGVIGPIVSVVQSGLVPVFEEITVFFEGIRPGIDNLVQGIKVLLEPVAKLVGAVVKMSLSVVKIVLGALVPAINWIANLVKTIFVAVGTGVEYLSSFFESLATFFQEKIIDPITNFIAKLFGWLGGEWMDTANKDMIEHKATIQESTNNLFGIGETESVEQAAIKSTERKSAKEQEREEGNSQRTAKIEAAIANLNRSVREGKNIYMDSTKVGNTIAYATSNM